MKNKENPSMIGVIWKFTLNTLKKEPVILVPFCISGALKLLGIAVIFLSIFYPLSIVFAPIIKTIWGEASLHYPFNFYLMPKLFYYVQIAIYIFIEGLLTAMAVWMVYQSNEERKPVLSKALKKVFPKYIILAAFLAAVFLIIYAISFGENYLIWKLINTKIIKFLFKKNLLDFIKVFVNFFIIVFIQTLFAFFIPFVVLEGKSFIKSITGSLALAKKLFPTTFLLIFVPTLLILPISVMKAGLPALMDKSVPEITFLVLGLGVVFALLVDAFVTASLTYLFLLRKDLGLEKIKK